MSNLADKHCKPCEGGVEPLARESAEELLGQLDDDWQLSEDGRWLSRDYTFKGFYRTIAFVNAVAWIANSENHHPDLVGHRLARPGAGLQDRRAEDQGAARPERDPAG